MEKPIRVSRNLSLEQQIYQENMLDDFTKVGLYEKTIDPDTREPVYLSLE